MHINTLLNEDFASGGTSIASPTQKISFNQLNTLQVRTLTRLANGEIDVETVAEKEFDILVDLQEIGLLDMDFNLTPSGNSIVAIAKRVGGSAELQDARERSKAAREVDARGTSVDGLDGMDDDFDIDPDFPPKL